MASLIFLDSDLKEHAGLLPVENVSKTGDMYVFSLLPDCLTDSLLGNMAKNSRKVIRLKVAGRLDEIALELREPYIKMIFDAPRNHGTGRGNLLALLRFEKVSLWWFHEISLKRSDAYPAFIRLCQIKLLERYVDQFGVDTVALAGGDEELALTLEAWARRKNLTFKRLTLEREKRNNIVKEFLAGKYLVKASYMHAKWFLMMLDRWLALRKTTDGSKDCDKGTRLYFSVYPQVWKESKYKYDIRYGDVTASSGKDKYLIALSADDFHHSLSGSDFRKCLHELKGRKDAVILDRCLGVGAILLCFLKGILIMRTCLRLSERFINAKNFTCEGVDLSFYLKKENMLAAIRLPRLLLQLYAFRKAFSRIKPLSMMYYLYEHAYGRVLTYAARTGSPETVLIGMQHGPISRRKLLYSAAPGEFVQGRLDDYISHPPMPDKISAENSAALEVLKESGLTCVEVMPEIHRLSYLKNVKRTPKNSGKVLIACGQHDGEYLLESCIDRIRQHPQETFILKPHPRSTFFKTAPERIKTLGLGNLHMADKQIQHYLSEVDRVIVTYSSVGEEAFNLGIPVEVVSLPIMVNQSSLI